MSAFYQEPTVGENGGLRDMADTCSSPTHYEGATILHLSEHTFQGAEYVKMCLKTLRSMG